MADQNILQMDIGFGGVSLTQKALFAKHLAVMLRSGLTIIEALSIARDSAEGRLKRAIGGVLKSVGNGRSLSSSFGEYPNIFSGLFVHATYAGETSGTLSENLENIAEQFAKEKELISKIQGAMIYPIVVLVATFFLGLGMAFFVLPKIVPIFEGLRVTLPPTTRALIAFSHFMEKWGYLFFLGVVAGITLFVWVVRQKFAKPITHWFFLHTPVVKRVSRGANIARFCRTLGTLLKSGVNIDEALEITKESMSNFYYRKSLKSVSMRIGKGTKLSESLSRFPALYPIIVTRMIGVGEESGKFEETLFYLADFYETEVDTATKSLATAVEPALLLFIGLLVGGLALAIITPIYQITGNIGR